ncbi:MAG: tetratricopeptide repeat protein [Pseudomonadota bacterium]
MNHIFLNKLPAVLGLGIVLASGARAENVTFFDGGYSEICSGVAVNVGDVEHVELTGSRLGVPSIEICTKAIESGESSPEQKAASYNNRGVLWFDEANYANALADFDAAIKTNDKLVPAYINRGYTFIAMKQWQDSIAAFDQALTHGDLIIEAPKVYYNRGLAHEELGHVREAYYDYKKASELDPLWPQPQAELSRFTVRK